MLGANAGRRRTDGGAAVRRSAAAQGQLGENRWLCVAGHIPAAAAGASCNHQRGDTAMKMFIALTILALALLGGTAATVILDTQAAMADGGCNGSNC